MCIGQYKTTRSVVCITNISPDSKFPLLYTKQNMVHPNFKLADPSLLLYTGWIDNAETKSKSGRERFPVHDPATDEVWAKVESMDEVDTDAAIAAAAAAFPAFSSVSARQRARMILELDRLVRQNKEDLAKIIVMESGKALVEARAEVDYAGEYACGPDLGHVLMG